MGNRFIKTHRQNDYDNGGSVTEIWIDSETGVNYLYHYGSSPYGSGLTVLVDRNGRPIVTPVEYL